MNKIDAISEATIKILGNDIISAQKVIEQNYPFKPIVKDSRKYTRREMMEQFYRDGFIDRYSGEKLINPGMLRVLSEKLPKEFPFQAHWKTDECHIAYWEYQPTVDHIFPIALGGKDSVENWASTSMKNNLIKSTFTLEQLEWELKPAGDIKEWDGLSKFFVSIVDNNKNLLLNSRIKDWYKITKICMSDLEI